MLEVTVAGIEGDGFVGRGDELLALLRHADPEIRSAAAVRIGQIHGEEAVGLPAEPALMAELARVDAIHPGVADAFWTTVVYDFVMCTPEFGTSQVNAWMLAVLQARKDDRALSPVPGNDLEFYAHEAFDDDPEALMKLLGWGYIDTVEMALDHGELAREPMIALLQAAYARRPRAYLIEALALGYAVLPAAPDWPLVPLTAGRRAWCVERDYAALWTVHWLFPEAPVRLPLGGEELLAVLMATGIEFGDQEAVLEPAKIGHIGFPELLGSRRVTAWPRGDLQVDIAVDAAEQVVVLRVVRVRCPRVRHEEPHR